MTASQTSVSSSPALELLKKAIESSVVLSAFLFVVGWSYLYGYFKAFGIPLQIVTVSVQDVIMHSFRAIANGGWAWAGFLLGGIIAGLLIAVLARNSAKVGPGLGTLALFAFFSLYCLASIFAAQVGNSRASKQMALTNFELPWVMVDLDPSKIDEVLFKPTNLLRGDYKLVLAQSDRIWVFKPAPEGTPEISVFMIPKEAIRAIRIQRSPNS